MKRIRIILRFSNIKYYLCIIFGILYYLLIILILSITIFSFLHFFIKIIK